VAFALARVSPNPAAGADRIGWSQPRAAEARLDVFDVGGRRLRTLDDRTEGAGVHLATWDLTDDRGSRVRPGLYFARLTVAGEGDRTRRLTVIR